MSVSWSGRYPLPPHDRRPAVNWNEIRQGVQDVIDELPLWLRFLIVTAVALVFAGMLGIVEWVDWP